MTQKYTEQDVSRLLYAAKFYSSLIKEAEGIKLPYSNYVYTGIDLDNALKPFLPDPEEELLEAMAKANNPHWDRLSPGTKEVLINYMRAILAVVKERGLPQ